ncbi:MAG: 50S ribosomal protein L30 [bacterium]|nr:50S ribosomal protein L30 [bacterium]
MSTLRIKLIKSKIGRKEKARRTLSALGLRRINQTVIRPDNPQIRGMVAHVVDMLVVEEGS